MISKERLQELINEGATIYSKNVLSYSLIKPYTYTIMDGTLYQVIGTKQISTCPIEKLENLYETKEQAKWSLKYHVTRTEELSLPTWEEIEKIKEKGVYIIARPREMIFYIDYKFLIPQIKLCTLEDVFNWNLDEEGYLSACDLCVKLFKGEEE